MNKSNQDNKLIEEYLNDPNMANLNFAGTISTTDGYGKRGQEEKDTQDAQVVRGDEDNNGVIMVFLALN